MGRMGRRAATRRLDARVASLAGRVIRSVRYVELANDAGEELWGLEDPDLDSVDHGLELVLDDGRVISVAWDHQFAHHDLNVFEGPLQPDVVSSGASAWDVTTRSRWSAVLGVPIQDARLDWLGALDRAAKRGHRTWF